MKKKMITLSLCATLITSIVSYAAQTGPKAGPSLTPGSTYQTKTYDFTSDKSVAKVSQTYAYFDNFNSLPSDLVANDGRKLTMCLFDYDWSGSDDCLKTYIGSFNGRKLIDVSVTTTTDNTYVDESDDDTAELYMRMFLDKCNKDATNTKSGSLFTYRFGIS